MHVGLTVPFRAGLSYTEAADAEPPRDLRCAKFLFNMQALDLGGIDR